MKRLTLAVLALSLLSGCFKTQYTYGPKAKGDSDHEEWRHRVAWGIIELSGPMDISNVCPDGEFSRIKTSNTLGNSIVGIVVRAVIGAGGIDWYSPSTIEVWCADGTAYRGTIDQDGTVLELEAPVDQGAAFLE